jgi:hemerythrin-like domain-containing protein
MSQVLEQLRRDHGDMRRLLQIIEEQMVLYRSGGVLDFDLLQAVMEYTLHFPHLVHHPKEDLVFKRLLQRDPASAEEILDLLTDHARLGALTRRFAVALHNVARDVELPRDLFEGIARRYVDDTRRHMELEEQDFFPRALLRLGSEDWAEIDAAITSPEDPLFGNRLADEYRKLHQRILELIE